MDISILRMGNFVILAVPGEFTTMAGRRLRQAVYDQVCSCLMPLDCILPGSVS